MAVHIPNSNELFQLFSLVDLGVLLTIGLIFFILRSNAIHARQVENINGRLQISLVNKQKREEDLLLLNRTLHEMNKDLEFANIIEAFERGAARIFDTRAHVGVYIAEPSHPNSYTLSDSRQSEFYIPIISIPNVESSNEREDQLDLDCKLFVKEAQMVSDCLSYRMSAYGLSGLVVLSKVNAENISSSEKILFQNLIKHLSASLQNASLLMKVEDANKSKTAFLANMSHEIRTPLNALMGFSQMIVRNDLSIESKEQLSDSITKNGEQLLRIVDDILDLSKAESGKLVVVKREVVLERMIEEIKSIMNPRAQDRKIDFSIEASGRIPDSIFTDAIRVKQILLNLIGNAIKFTDNGYVRVKVAHEARDEKHSLVFRVEDSGIGIPAHMRTAIFQPFSQGDNSYTRRFGGTGLGLAISTRLAAELGGDLEIVSSQPGVGSVFQLRIDVGDCENVSWSDHFKNEDTMPVAKVEIKDRLRDSNILLVEDSPDNQDFFSFYLQQAGAHVTLVDNGVEAVKLALTNSYDVILMDIQIPGIDGKEATKRIRAEDYSGPIIALTAHALTAEREECLASGCNTQISKPVSGENLVLGVQKMLQRGANGFTNRNVQKIY